MASAVLEKPSVIEPIAAPASAAPPNAPAPSAPGQGLEPIIKLENCKLVSQGAEARVFETTFLGRPTILKQRFNKKYRHPVLDLKLTTMRLKQEVRSLMRARKIGVLVPAPYFVELEANSIYMEQIVGHSVAELMKSIGKSIAAMHDGGLIHGDLTTSNMMVCDSDKKLFDKILASYKAHSSLQSATFNRFAEGRPSMALAWEKLERQRHLYGRSRFENEELCERSLQSALTML
eukprot:gene15006-21074_t